MSTPCSFLFLGSGGSMGVPMMGCGCPVCLSDSPFNKRLRPSGLVTIFDKKFLIDTGPDLRSQALRANVRAIDGVLYTHAHSDHLAGIDDLRAFYFCSKRPVPCLLSQATFEDIEHRYHYLFQHNGGRPVSSINSTAKLDFHLLSNSRGEVSFEGVAVRYFSYTQGLMPVSGFRFGEFAYVTDIREYPQSIFEDLSGVRYLVLSAAQYQATKIHFSVDEAVAFSAQVGAEKVWLTHLTHRVEHHQGNKGLPEGVSLGYDGLKIDFHMDGYDES